MRSILKTKSPSAPVNESSPPRPPAVLEKKTGRHRRFSEDSAAAAAHFDDFLHRLPKAVAAEVMRYSNNVIEKIHAHPEIPVIDLSVKLQDFYQILSDRIQRISAFKGIEGHRDQIEVAYVCFFLNCRKHVYGRRDFR